MIPLLVFFGESGMYSDIMTSRMLQIQKRRRPGLQSTVLMTGSLLLFAAGAYLLLLIATPAVTPYLPINKIDPEALASPQPDKRRLIIPKIGVDITYGETEAALDTGAQWRYPDRGSPSEGGNFIVAAHRFELAPTPQGILQKSPFYHIDKLTVGDQIIVDYDGKRYGYTISRIYDVKPTQVEIEAPSETAKMTLYTCTLGGATDGRVVVEAEPLGQITLDTSTVQDDTEI